MKTSVKVFHWMPRSLCILAILFISMFAADAFAPGLTLSQQLPGFLMHLIPSFILLSLLIVSWKWEYTGGIIFILIGLLFSPLIFYHNYNMNHSVWMSLGIISFITLPFIIIGILFMISSRLKKKDLAAV